MQKAVVSTSIGAEGLQIEHGRNLLIADEPRQFALSIAQLLRNQSLREYLGENGRDLVASKYDWKMIACEMNHIYNEVANYRNRRKDVHS